MTERDLSTLVREHVTSDEPAFLLSPATPIGHGRRVVRRRRTVAGMACAAVLAVASVSGSYLVPTGDPRADDAATGQTDYDPERLAQVAREKFSAEVPDLPKGDFVVLDEYDRPLPSDLYDYAHSISTTFGSPHGNLLSAGARSGIGDVGAGKATDLERICTDRTTRNGDVFPVCSVSEENGQVIVMEVTKTGSKDGLEAMPPYDHEGIAFRFSVTSYRAGGFVVSASERVLAETLGEAERMRRSSNRTLRDIAVHPELGIDKPAEMPAEVEQRMSKACPGGPGGEGLEITCR